jgi:hypothetical protein
MIPGQEGPKSKVLFQTEKCVVAVNPTLSRSANPNMKSFGYDLSVMLVVKAGKRLLSSSSWRLPVRSVLLASTNKPRFTAFIDLLPEVNCGGVMKVGLEWILALMPCTTLVASGLLYFLFIVATHGWVALIALAVVLPPAPGASSGGATNQRAITMALRPRGLIPSGRHWMFLIELYECVLGQILQPLYPRIGW